VIVQVSEIKIKLIIIYFLMNHWKEDRNGISENINDKVSILGINTNYVAIFNVTHNIIEFNIYLINLIKFKIFNIGN
jgi:hypothetical protein